MGLSLRGGRLHRALVLALVLIPAIAPALAADTAAAPGAQALSEDERIMALVADDARREDSLDPLGRLSRGEKVDPAALSLVFTDALSRRRLASVSRSLADLARVRRDKLSP